MQIVVNHLTRMQPGYVCVAGIDLSNGQHIRPVLRYGRLTRDLLALNGGPFSMASLVDLGPVKYCGQAPELEDHCFQFLNAHNIGIVPPERFWQLLQSTAHTSIVEIFGSAIQSLRRGCTIDGGTPVILSVGLTRPRKHPDDIVERHWLRVNNLHLKDNVVW
jgi:hypothetical protein